MAQVPVGAAEAYEAVAHPLPHHPLTAQAALQALPARIAQAAADTPAVAVADTPAAAAAVVADIPAADTPAEAAAEADTPAAEAVEDAPVAEAEDTDANPLTKKLKNSTVGRCGKQHPSPHKMNNNTLSTKPTYRFNEKNHPRGRSAHITRAHRQRPV